MNHAHKTGSYLSAFALSFLAVLTGCNQFDNSLPMINISIYADYDDDTKKMYVSSTDDIDENIKMFDKRKPSKVVRHLLPGDLLEVYYKDTDFEIIDHILVETVDVLPVKYIDVSESNDSHYKVVATDENVSLDYIPRYLIDQDKSYHELGADDYNQTLYGTYRERNSYYRDDKKVISLKALYSYDPSRDRK